MNTGINFSNTVSNAVQNSNVNQKQSAVQQLQGIGELNFQNLISQILSQGQLVNPDGSNMETMLAPALENLTTGFNENVLSAFLDESVVSSFSEEAEGPLILGEIAEPVILGEIAELGSEEENQESILDKNALAAQIGLLYAPLYEGLLQPSVQDSLNALNPQGKVAVLMPKEEIGTNTITVSATAKEQILSARDEVSTLNSLSKDGRTIPNESSFRMDEKPDESAMAKKVADTQTNFNSMQLKTTELEEKASGISELGVLEKTIGETEFVKKSNEVNPNDSKAIHGGIVPENVETFKTQAQAVEKAEVHDQIGQEILSKLQQKAPMEFKLQLEPENLGQIDIKLKLNDGKLVIDIMAASAKTQALLTSQVDKLVASMGLQNVRVENVHVHYQGQDSQEQFFDMNGGMGFFQRKQQERYQEQIINRKNLANSHNFQNDSGIASVANMSRIQRMKDGSYGMDYLI